MKNQEIADWCLKKVPEKAAKDFYDRFLDLAIYINESCKDGDEKDLAISDLLTALETAYSNKRL
jgi:hypothetical protein